MLLTLLNCLVLLLSASACNALSDYFEQLVLQPLAPASVLASFNFRSNASHTSYNQQHFQYFPRSLGQILQHARARELHLRFSSGRCQNYTKSGACMGFGFALLLPLCPDPAAPQQVPAHVPTFSPSVISKIQARLIIVQLALIYLVAKTRRT